MTYQPTTTTTVDDVFALLKRWRGRIWYKKAWTQNVFARDKKGNPVSFNSPKATCYCALGALQLEADDTPTFDAVCRLITEHSKIARAYGGYGGVSYVNDVEGHKKVIQMINEIIKLVETAIKDGTAESLIS